MSAAPLFMCPMQFFEDDSCISFVYGLYRLTVEKVVQ